MPRIKEFVPPDAAMRARRQEKLAAQRRRKIRDAKEAAAKAKRKAERDRLAAMSAQEKAALKRGRELDAAEDLLPEGSDEAPATTSTFRLTPRQQEAMDLLANHVVRYFLLVGGSRSGKTFFIVRAIVMRALRAPNSRHAIFRLRLNACRATVYQDTFKKVMRICFPSVEYEYQGRDDYVRLPNGSEIWFGGLDDNDRVEKILGMEFATIYVNESSQVSWPSVEILLTRLAQKVPGLVNRFFCDLNPTTKKHWTYRLFVQGVDPLTLEPKSEQEKAEYAWMRVNPSDNVENLDKDYLRSLQRGSKRTQKRFLQGEYADALDNALWTPELLEKCRIDVDAKPQNFEKLAVAVDPSGTKGEEHKRSDEIGITVAGLYKGRAYVLLDASFKGKPEAWGARVSALYHAWLAGAVVGETNYGGDMVRATIHAVDESVKFVAVTASRGKVVRAEPISALFEADRVRMVGDDFKELEEELCNFTSEEYKGDRSPNRADAMVWVLTYLLGTAGTHGMLDFARLQMEADADPERPVKPPKPAPVVTKVKVNVPVPIERPCKTVYDPVTGLTHTVREGWGHG